MIPYMVSKSVGKSLITQSNILHVSLIERMGRFFLVLLDSCGVAAGAFSRVILSPGLEVSSSER